jgi:hypothetical protein
MDISKRIVQAPACTVINLDEAEKDIYSGTGWKIAHFKDGALAEFFDPLAVAYSEDIEAMTQEALDKAIAWLDSKDGETWLVLCSCYQLCDPTRISKTDALSIAKLGRVFSEQFIETQE